MKPSSQPERLIARCLQQKLRLKKVYVSDRQLRPPLYSHVVAFPRLEIPLKGCYENQIEQNGEIKTVCLRPGTALFSAPNCWNLPTWRFDLELISILFGKKHLGISIVTGSGRDTSRLMAQKLSIPFPLVSPLPHILDAIAELQAANGSPETFVDLSLALIRCVHDLTQHPDGQITHKAQNLFESVCVYLQNHYQHDITRDSVAGEFKVTPNHLSRLFRARGHLTFNNYLNHVRIDRGKYLLCNYNLKLDDVAVRCGFVDTPYFCRVFRRVTSKTPAEYRSIYRGRNIINRIDV
jgi:AraC-like DNA-binding protein